MARIALYRKKNRGRPQSSCRQWTVAFRQLLQNEFGMESRKDMSIGQLSRHLQSSGRTGREIQGPAKSRNNRVTSNARPDFIEIRIHAFRHPKRQILAIWRKLGYSMSSLDTRVKRAFGVHLLCLAPG